MASVITFFFKTRKTSLLKRKAHSEGVMNKETPHSIFRRNPLQKYSPKTACYDFEAVRRDGSWQISSF
jgi:hypothetical protein